MKKENIKAKKIYIPLLMVLVVFVTFFFIYSSFSSKEMVTTNDDLLSSIPIQVQEDNLPNLASEDDIEAGYVVVTCKDKLNEERDDNLSDYALLSLHEYLNRYIKYYIDIPVNEVLQAEYVSGSYKSDVNSPSFRVNFLFKNDSVVIECIYDNTSNRYNFFSKLSE